MLKLWKALEDGDVNLNYVPPPADEKTIPSDPGIIVPVVYSSFKPYLLADKVRHGILHSKSANPQNFPDPLEGVYVSRKDLDAYKINSENAYAVFQKRIVYQEQRIAKSESSLVRDISQHLSTLGKTNELYNTLTYLKEIAEITNDDQFLKAVEGLRTNFYKLMMNLPGKAESKLPAIIDIGELKHFLNEKEIEKKIKGLKNFVSKIIEHSEEELKATEREYDSSAVKNFCRENNIDYNKMKQGIRETPIAFQQFYRRIMLLDRAQEVLAKEKHNNSAHFLADITTSPNPAALISKIDIASLQITRKNSTSFRWCLCK